MKLAITAVLALIIGALAGGYFGGQLGGKGGTVLGVCEMAKVAVAEGLLDSAEVLELASATGRGLGANYPQIAARLTLSEDSAGNASSASDCSQFLVNMSRAIKAGTDGS